jgi:ketosteroid isomerase-like protein
MKIFISAILLSFMAVSSAFTQDTDVRAFIERTNATWQQAMMDGDVNAIMRVYDDDIISLPSYASMIRGKDELAQHLRKELESGDRFTNVEFNTVEVREEGNLAIEVGTYNISLRMGQTGEEWNDQGKYLTIWERQGNEWKVVMETWNTDTNPWEQMQDHQNKPLESE